MRRCSVGENECGGRLHVAVTATLTVLAKAMMAVSGSRRGKRGKTRRYGVLDANLKMCGETVVVAVTRRVQCL